MVWKKNCVHIVGVGKGEPKSVHMRTWVKEVNFAITVLKSSSGRAPPP